ncbi:MAG: hypothetical protein JST53_05150 [Actinobacteria bacterium]|nr:hypothetical protein [Actinomycetota bacterium]
MRALVPKLLTAALLALAALVPASVASAAPTLTGVFKLTTGKLNPNNKIVAGPDGNMWFTVDTLGKQVAKITPAGEITEYELPGATGATGIAVGPEGKLWLTAVEKAISFSPGDPKGSEKAFEVPSIGANGQITAGPNGEIWVASNEKVTHFSPADPKGKNGETPIAGLAPKDIATAATGVVVAGVPGKLVTVGADGKRGPDISLGGETMTSQGVAAGASGQVAFSKSDGTEGLGLVIPPAPPTEVLMMGDPFGATTGTDGNYWFAMSAAHGLERLTPTGEASALPFVGFETWFPRQLNPGPANTLWVLMEVPGSEYAVAKITGVEPPAPPTPSPTPAPPVIKVAEKAVPDTVLGKHPKKVVKTTGAKATVTFTFSSTVPGSTFRCKLVKPAVGKKKMKPKAAFVGCRSPKVLKLAPGKYRFAVRAVSPEGVTGSPVESAFKVVRASRHK